MLLGEQVLAWRGIEIEGQLAATGLAIAVTGFVDEAEYTEYLMTTIAQAADGTRTEHEAKHRFSDFVALHNEVRPRSASSRLESPRRASPHPESPRIALPRLALPFRWQVQPQLGALLLPPRFPVAKLALAGLFTAASKAAAKTRRGQQLQVRRQRQAATNFASRLAESPRVAPNAL